MLVPVRPDQLGYPSLYRLGTVLDADGTNIGIKEESTLLVRESH
jgi:hypothetical protein